MFGPTGEISNFQIVENNAENLNPNLLRDPRLTLLEDENRALKEELKKT